MKQSGLVTIFSEIDRDEKEMRVVSIELMSETVGEAFVSCLIGAMRIISNKYPDWDLRKIAEFLKTSALKMKMETDNVIDAADLFKSTEPTKETS